MKTHSKDRSLSRNLLGLALAAGLMLPLPSLAATVALASSPLVNSTTSTVKPNVMFMLDDSGSMSWDYMPDWAASSHPVTSTKYYDMPELFRNNGFNGVAYNPAITYTPPVLYNANGTLNTTTYLNIGSPWTAVKYDAYGVQSYNNIPLTPDQRCPDGNYPSGTAPNGACNLVGSASFYTFVPGEYCSSDRMTSCVTASAPTTISGVLYDKPAPLRWCNSAALTTCQSINNSTYKYPRYPRPPYATIRVDKSDNSPLLTVSQISVNGQDIMSAAATGSTTESTTATSIRDKINACTAAITGSCTVAGFSATVSSTTVTIYAPASMGAITYTPVKTGSATTTITAFANGVPGSILFTNIVSTTASYPYPGQATKASSRTDCASTTCTYTEEMTNYANWWTYYHTRMQAMKTSVSRAFNKLDNRFRVGFSTINYTGATDGTEFLGNNTFELAHKNSWYTKLFSTVPDGSTPLRGSLAKAGRYYGKKLTTQVDPVQYSCQQNFTILSTDGYWNDSSTNAIDLNGGAMTNMDGGTTARPMYEGPTASDNSLADIAKYYYDTDLRTSTLSNCAGGSSPDFLSGNPDVCTNNVFVSPSDNNVQQHMTTFTMGLGADGTLIYNSDYETATSGDFYDLTEGLGTPVTVNWPDPINKSAGERIDDLWHAAVNGKGTYFSAKDPNQIITGLNKALSAITAKLGSAAAAATSTLNPVAGNNFAYVASYTTVKWTGNLEARSINTDTGIVSETATWCVENVKADTCASPGTIVSDSSGASTIYNCVVADVTSAECPAPGVFDSGTSKCITQIADECNGTMPDKVDKTSDTRNIYTANNAGTAVTTFDAAYAVANPTNFSTTHINGLNQWGSLDTSQQTAAAGENLVNYLRGQTGYEMRSSNAVADQLYRVREATLGDALESQPSFISKPVFSYPYPGYSDYKTDQASREGVVFMGVNDGMMHAFYTQDSAGAGDPCVVGATVGEHCGGEEAWAYVPTMVIPNMWKLASTDYDTSHRNFINGSPIISDVCVANCSISALAVWKTILVAGLNGGGRGYFALDVTIPGSPVLLWEFTPSTVSSTSTGTGIRKDDDLGFSYGRPVITRKADGTWVVLVTSGYNNVSPGTGKGFLYVLNAGSGVIISKIATGIGSTTTPSGLAQIAVRNDEPAGNRAGYVYGGDLLGNLWRFDINSTTVAAIGTGSVLKFATLFSDNAGTLPQPVTTTPILGSVASKPVVFVGTGKYLEQSDLTDTQVQTLYAIKDDNASTTLVNPRSQSAAPNKMIEQTITQNGSVREETTSQEVNFTVDRGWFIDFPDGGTGGDGAERMNIDGRLVQGTLIIPTIVPSSSVCSPGGYGWLNYFDYQDGSPTTDSSSSGPANINVSVKYDTTIVGINVIYIKGKPVVEVVTSNNPTPTKDDSVQFSGKPGQFTGNRGIWREIMR